MRGGVTPAWRMLSSFPPKFPHAKLQPRHAFLLETENSSPFLSCARKILSKNWRRSSNFFPKFWISRAPTIPVLYRWRSGATGRPADLVVPMASEQPGDESRRPPPLGLRGLSRVAFQARSSPTSSRLPPLGLAGRATLPSFSIGSATREPVSQPMAEAARASRPPRAPTRRVGLSRPSRPPPAPDQAGPSSWASSPSRTGSDGDARSTYVGFNLFNGGGGISFGGGDFSMGGMSSAGGIGIGQSSSMFGGTSTTTGYCFAPPNLLHIIEYNQ